MFSLGKGLENEEKKLQRYCARKISPEFPGGEGVEFKQLSP